MKTPGPDHPITLTPSPRRLRARAQGEIIADSADALMLKEASYKEVAYFPPADVRTEILEKSALKTTCPYKGEASYYTVLLDGRRLENAVWSYEDPYPAMAALRGRMAFYPDRVEVAAADGEA